MRPCCLFGFDPFVFCFLRLDESLMGITDLCNLPGFAAFYGNRGHEKHDENGSLRLLQLNMGGLRSYFSRFSMSCTRTKDMCINRYLHQWLEL